MTYVPSAAAQATATLAGSNMASLAAPLTALQTSIAGGNLAPSAYLDAVLSSVGYQAKIIDTAGPGSSNTTSSTTFSNMPTGCSGTFAAALAKTYLVHVDISGVFESTTGFTVGFQLVVNTVAATPVLTAVLPLTAASTRLGVSFRQPVAMSSGSNVVQLQWKVSGGTATFDASSFMTVHVTG